MSENKKISKTSKRYSISKIFLIIFITLTFSLIGLLRYGISIDHINTSHFLIQQLYIKWDKKLAISAKNITILSKNTDSSKQINPKEILKFITKLYTYFQTIDIQQFQLGDLKLSLLYSDKQNGYITLYTKDLTFQSKLFLDNNNIYVKIEQFNYTPFVFSATGYVLFDKANNTLETQLDCNLTQEASFHIQSTLEKGVIYYTFSFPKEIKNYKTILNSIPLPKGIQYWVDDAITTSSLQITQCKGSFSLENPLDGLKKLFIQAKAKQLSYKYHPNIKAVQTDYTLLEFKNGILYIKPHNPKTYGYNLEKSYLTIDFTKPQEILTLYLRFHKSKLDKNILHILSTYHIQVPLSQNSGWVDTNLTLKVNLRTIQVEADGTFYVKKGNFYYLGKNIDVAYVKMDLHNTHIQIKNMYASINQQIQAKVNVDLALAKQEGKIDFIFSKINLKDYAITLQKPIKVSYLINKNQLDIIEIPLSHWNINGKKCTINALHIPFDFQKKIVFIPKTVLYFNKKNILSLKGKIFLKTQQASLQCKLKKFHYKAIQLAQNSLPFQVKLTKKSAIIKTSSSAKLLLDNETPILIKPTKIVFKNNTITTSQTTLKVPNIFSATINITYNMKTAKGDLNLYKSNFALEGLAPIFQNNKLIKFQIYNHSKLNIFNNNLEVALYERKDQKIVLKFKSLKKLLPYSQMLQQYKITGGTILIIANEFYGSLQSQYKLLLNHNILTNNYSIEGTVKEENTIIKINKNISISTGKTITVKGFNTALNLIEIENLISNVTTNSSKTSSIPIQVNLKKGYLYISQKRKILFDKLKINISDTKVHAKLQHHNAIAIFKYKNGKFHLYGSKFDDVFMDNLFMQSKFKKGSLNFDMIGSFDVYDGIVEIVDTTILDYKILNNILAFIDTVPSLVTFSLPKYSTQGLKVQQAYASFHFENEIFHFDNISLHSDSIDINGKGEASYTKDYIKLLLQLKTKLANKASKIPVVGYILFDGKTLSTSLKVEGKLTNPKVSLTLAQDIAVAPLNIIKRTILYPLHLFGLDKE